MKRGPKPTPSAQLKRRGSWRADTNAREPMPDPSPPPVPVLSAAARRVWDALAPQLHAMGVLTSIDGNTLATYCETWVLWRAALRDVRRRGQVVELRGASPGKYPKGHKSAGLPIPGPVRDVKTNPSARLLRQHADSLVRLSALLGLDPSSRRGLHAFVPYKPDSTTKPGPQVDPSAAPAAPQGKARFFVHPRVADGTGA